MKWLFLTGTEYQSLKKQKKKKKRKEKENETNFFFSWEKYQRIAARRILKVEVF